MFIKSLITFLIGLLGWVFLSQFPNRPADIVLWDDFSVDGSKIQNIDIPINTGKDVDLLYNYANAFDKRISFAHSNQFLYEQSGMAWSRIQLIQHITGTQILEIGYEEDKITFYIPSFIFTINGKQAVTKKNIIYITTWVQDEKDMIIGDQTFDIGSIRAGTKYQILLWSLRSSNIKNNSGEDISYDIKIDDDSVIMYEGIAPSDILDIRFIIHGDNILSRYNIDRNFEDGTWDRETWFAPQECNKLPSVDAPDMRWYYNYDDKTWWDRSIGLYTTNRETCMKYDLDIPLDTNKTYMIAFDYKSIVSGYVILSYILSGDKEEKIIDIGYAVDENRRKTFTHFFTPLLSNPKLSLLKFSVIWQGQPVEVLFDNLRIYEASADMFGDFDVKIVRWSSSIVDKNTVVEYNNQGKRYYRWIIHNVSQPVLLGIDRSYDRRWSFIPIAYDVEKIDTWYVSPAHQNYIEKNYLSKGGDKYISIVYGHSLINQNISKPSIYGEHLFYDRIDDTKHYDGEWNNVWYIDPTDVCGSSTDFCKINEDGSFDISWIIKKKISLWWHILYRAAITGWWYRWIGRKMINRREYHKNTY